MERSSFDDDLAARLPSPIPCREFQLLEGAGLSVLMQHHGRRISLGASFFDDHDLAEFALRAFTRLEAEALRFSAEVMV